ncbi:hypothetical protein NQ318_012016 [Aromia moschata]|uniref:DUF4817 domain-containing protein n=1 Tax=Aromia moschata TaxID=1265417 RepID=A0AAV8YD93_9CUCU|nr:hypothetical protein NQ318_012016 [Aromia moschata]
MCAGGEVSLVFITDIQWLQNMTHTSERQRIEILMIYGYGNRKRTQSEVCTVFNGIYPDTPVSQRTVCQPIKKFRETGNVKDVKRTGRPKSATKDCATAFRFDNIEEVKKKNREELSAISKDD